MQKLFKSTLMLFTAMIFITILASSNANASKEKIITVTSPSASIYNMIDGKQVNVGKLIKGQQYTVRHEDARFYYVPFGNSTAYFAKSNATKATTTFYKNVQGNSNTVVITKHITSVYEGKTASSKVLGMITTNMRYPIIATEGSWYKVNIGGNTGYIAKSAVTVDNGIPVLMYHHMVEDPKRAGHASNNMVITVSAFNQQMAYLKKNGYRTIKLDQLENYLRHRQNLTGKVVAITFDDGNLSTVKYAYPTMKKYGFKATSFIIGGRIRQESKPWNEKTLQFVGLKEMTATMDVYDHQHHSMSMHVRDKNNRTKSLYETRSVAEIKNDTVAGTKQISRIYENGDTSHVKYLAYPFGMYNKNTIKGASAGGIKLAFTTKMGNVKLGDAHYELKRQGVSPKTSMKDFENKLNGTFK